MPARDARNAVRSSVLTQADVHFEAFSAGRRAPAELGLPSPALEFVGTDDAVGEPVGDCCALWYFGELTIRRRRRIRSFTPLGVYQGSCPNDGRLCRRGNPVHATCKRWRLG